MLHSLKCLAHTYSHTPAKTIYSGFGKWLRCEMMDRERMEISVTFRGVCSRLDVVDG